MGAISKAYDLLQRKRKLLMPMPKFLGVVTMIAFLMIPIMLLVAPLIFTRLFTI